MMSSTRSGTVRSVTLLQLSRWLVPSLVSLLTVFAFLPVLENGFVDWDDKANFLENRSYRGLGWEQLRWMFTTFHKGHYQPLSWVTLGLDYILWGVEPFGYHLTNLLLHAANAVLFYFLAFRLLALALSVTAGETLSLRISAAFAALVFAIHPLRVESVAWATERRDVLSALFILSTLVIYLRSNEMGLAPRTRIWRLVGALAVYSLSLLSNARGMSLLVVLLVLDFYPLRRLGDEVSGWFGRATRAVWVEKIPYLLLAMAAGLTALLAQYQAGALGSIESHGVGTRIAQGFYGTVFYLWKTVVPVNLSPLYEIPRELNPLEWPYVVSGVLVVVITLSLILLRRCWPAGLAVWVCYLAMLAPVLGAAQSGPQFVADRYSYLSCLGWAILAGAALFHCWRVGVVYGINRTLLITSGVVSLVVIGLGGLTWKQSQVWYDTERLWRHALTIDQESRTPHNNLGVLLASHGKLDEAIQHYHRAIDIDPNYVKAYNNLGNALWIRGETEEAIHRYQKALRIDPNNADAHYNLGNGLRSQGKLEEAIAHYEQALRVDPSDSLAHKNLAISLAELGHINKAMVHFREALRLDPDDASNHANLANIFAARDESDQAVEHYRRAVQLDPNNSSMHANLANIFAARGESDEAVEHYRRAVQLNPKSAEVHEALGQILASQGRQDEAIRHLEEAVRLMKIGQGSNRRKIEKRVLQ